MAKFNQRKSIVTILFICLFITKSYAADEAGKTMITKGDVNATSSEQGDKRTLKRRSSIFVDDIVTTGTLSNTQLRMSDGSMIAMKENSELVIAEYNFGGENGKDSVVLELVQGGLRSITGAIKAEKGDYKLKTPIGSIGIRGTHYEVQISNETVWIAVWDGAIDVELTLGLKSGTILSLGVGEKYSYVSIDKNGVITSYIEPPKIFEQGMSSKATDVADLSTVNDSYGLSIEEKKPLSNDIETEDIITYLDNENTEFIKNDQLNSLEAHNIYELVATRQGLIEYSQATVSSTYNLTNFSAGMVIDFDSGRISNGHLSFDDDRSTDPWNAVFNGNMHITNEDVILEVDITFASHGNNLADGDISAQFIDLLGLDAVSGGFELFDETSGTEVDGSYLIKNK